MNNLKSAIKKAKEDNLKDFETMMIEYRLNELLEIKQEEKEDRQGLHASAILVSEGSFCLREQVLSLFFKRGEENLYSVGLKRVFREGDMIHLKWQNLFRQAKVSRGIEVRLYGNVWGLLATPDAIIEINNKLYVVEIKSARTEIYSKMKDKHPSGNKQLQLYMHLLAIPRGFVLVENKNDQEFKIFKENYDPEEVRPYIERLNKIKIAKEKFIEQNKLPKRICSDYECKRGNRCIMKDACWGVERIKI